MKKTVTIALLLLLGVATHGWSQCTPDPNHTGAGFYPLPTAPLPSGTVNMPYAQVITINVPADTTLNLTALIGFPTPPVTVTVVSQTIGVTNGLPIGFFATPNPFSGIILGGQSGCLDVSGTTTTSGQYVFNIPTTLLFTVPPGIPIIGGTNQSIPIPVAYNLDITGASAVDPAGVDGFSVSQNVPNPTSGMTEVRYAVTGLSDVELSVVDLAGKQVLHQSENGVSGSQRFRFDAINLAPGLYIYRLSDGKKSIVKKMIVE